MLYPSQDRKWIYEVRKRVGCILRDFFPCYQHLSFSCFYQDSRRVSCPPQIWNCFYPPSTLWRAVSLSGLYSKPEQTPIFRLHKSPNSQMCNILLTYLVTFNYHSDTRQAVSPLTAHLTLCEEPFRIRVRLLAILASKWWQQVRLTHW